MGETNKSFKADKEQYDRAIAYLSEKSSTFADLYKILTDSPDVIWISFNNNQRNEFVAEGDFNKDYIYWDPRHGLVLGDDTVLSPALILAHEMGHAEQWINGGYLSKVLDGTVESDNLSRWENPIARQLGEYVRTDYNFVASSHKYVKVNTSTDWGVAPLNTNKAWYMPWTWGQPNRNFTNQNTWKP